MIRNAVVPVAGLGTRLLPATKCQPKEMLPVAKKPIVQYVVEELVGSGVDRILFVTGRDKNSIENHFDRDPELIASLKSAAKDELLEELAFEELGASFLYTRQSEQLGLGHAVLHGEAFVGHDPFIVALGDSIIGVNGRSDVAKRMSEAYESTQAAAIIAVEEVEHDMLRHYGVVKPDLEVQLSGDDVFAISDLVEKPSPDEAPSNLAIAGRYVFAPLIFDMIRRVKPDKKGEIQLTEAIRMLCQTGRRVVGVKLKPGVRRYDIGNFSSYYETFIEFALADPKYGDRVRKKLKELLA